jgi:ankyrin repeat protein
MSTLNHSRSNDNTTDISPSQPDEQSEQSFLLPSSEKLSVDNKLKLSNENFKQTIHDFFEDNNITSLSQLKATPDFPTPHVLAQFASKTYTVYEKLETDAHYEKRLALPYGWKLLTTASNNSEANGYFGAAYWHPEHQQVVIAHRGTKPTNVGALWTDVWGIMLNHYVRQMNSASTFAHEVVEVLESVSQKKGVIFQLFYTGHSLGGWLAQITTFTTKYLKREGNIFLKSNDVQDCYHPHTVVFDSPGCHDMLSQMTQKLDVRYEGSSTDLQTLDITSYLSAPNLINTCNKHVGTVYRIFTDLSDMNLLKKNTALYNLVTHSMDKIVKAFDPETGQVLKDEQGKLKVKVVIDWPVSGGDCKRFFKGAKHLNDYHQEVEDVKFQIEGYHPMRYQTKTYDERVSKLSVFCEQERQFLESYRWLRQLPEFFKPKELFSVMEDDQAQEDAEEILKSFEIEKDTIRCTNGTALQAIIPYVKRLLQLFPEVNESTTSALSFDEVRKRVYQIETTRYIERISQSPLDFKADVLSLRDFVGSDHKQVLQLQMVDGDEWTGIIKIHQVLQKTGCLSEGQYTVLKLERFLTVNQLMDFSTLMQSTGTPHLLLMACDTNQLLNGESQRIIRKLFTTIKDKPYIKIFLSTRSEGTTLPCLQQICREIFGDGFDTRDEKLTWSDITTESQEELLEHAVNFQGINIALNELISADSPLANSLPIGAIMEENPLQIGMPVPISDAYNEGYYIGRTLRRRRRGPTEQGSDMSVKLLWQQLEESLETPSGNIDTDSSDTYTPNDLFMLLVQAMLQGVMLISDTAGMGKSTELTYLSNQIKECFPSKWVIRIDLNDHTGALKTLENETIDKEKAIEFVSEKLLKHQPGLEKELFKHCCEQNQKVRVVIMLDGVDEISPFYKQTVIRLLQALRQTAVEQLWVTTRPHMRNELEDKLQQLSYTLEPFTEENHVEFFTKFWSTKNWFIDMYNMENENTNIRLERYAKYLISKLGQSTNDIDREIAGIPLLCRMMAETFEEEVETFCQSGKLIPELEDTLDLLELYGRFIERKYDIYQEEKLQARLSNVPVTEQRKHDSKCLREDHQLLALKVLFNDEQVALFRTNEECTFPAEQLSRIGIAKVSHDGRANFIHRTFAEYFVADCLMNQLTKGPHTSQQEHDFLFQKILLEEDYETIRVFIDGFILRSKLLEGVLKQCGERMHDLWEDSVLPFDTAVQEGNTNIIGFLLDSVQAAGHEDILVEQLLAHKSTTWQQLAVPRHIEVLKKLRECAKKKLTKEKNVNLLLAKDSMGRTAWHNAAVEGHTVVLETLWEWAKGELTPDELKNDLLLGKDYKERTAWHQAARMCNIKELLKWAEQKLTKEELHNRFLLATDDKGHTAWHAAIEKGYTDMLTVIWNRVKKELNTEELYNEMLLAKFDGETTAWHVAANLGNAAILQKFWLWAKEMKSTGEINNNLLLARDKKERTALHVATLWGRIEVMEKVREFANEEITMDEVVKKLLLATDNWGVTAWQIAVMRGDKNLSVQLWEWAKEKLTTDELKHELLLAKHAWGRTAWHDAAEAKNTEMLDILWEWGKEQLTTEELSNRLLLAKDDNQKNAWQLAAMEGNTESLQKIWEWAKAELSTEELNNEFLLAKDDRKMTAWHMAADCGKIESLQSIWKWAKQELTAGELENRLLLAKDDTEQTAFEVAAEKGNTEVLEILHQWAVEGHTPEELNNLSGVYTNLNN